MSEEAPPSRTATTPEMKPLLAEHADLGATFLDHQARLVVGDAAGSEDALHAFRGRLCGHLVAEERLVLPLYEARVEAPKGGRVDYFRNEHVKLERQLTESAAWMAAWRGKAWPPQEVVLLVERQKVFKEIMEHHDEREGHFLYPGIEDVTDAVARRDLLASFRQVASDVEQRWSTAAVGTTPEDGGSRASRGPALDATEQGGIPLPAQVAAWCLERLEECVAALAEEREKPRAPAPWNEGRQRLQAVREGLSVAHEGRRTSELVDATALLLMEVIPVKRFPVARAAEVQSSWHLVKACGRAARSRS